MSALGKFLAFANIFFSVGLLSWAVSIYANRLDWTDRTSDTGTVKGEITQLKEEIDRISKSLGDLQGVYADRLNNPVTGLLSREAVRDFRAQRYRERLESARKGAYRQQLEAPGSVGQSVFTDLSKEGPPILGPDNQPLRGLDALRADLDRAVRESQELIQGTQPMTDADWMAFEQLTANAQAFNDRLAQLGITDLRKAHGLLSDRVSVADTAILKQKEILGNLRDEATLLSSLQTNWLTQLQTLERRENQLERRLQALGGGR